MDSDKKMDLRNNLNDEVEDKKKDEASNSNHTSKNTGYTGMFDNNSEFIKYIIKNL